ncbi:DUF86 domain-containing protein [Terasakiella sp. SH-1]|uniref:HepT-like ribonuclease domain-containing protein n=1 Tax=Terasakiella sp. SH-1 TaxID=2560057 RepID=UPI0010736360|nr:DUF86 domain-containing protein [Terasakiella sp. SH-1]
MTKPQRHERWTFHLEQMITAINKIERYVRGMKRKDFLRDDRTMDAVIRNLEIIGEATHHVPNKVRKHYKAVPWMALRHMRNFIAHEYFDVDPRIIWETVARDLQGLKMSLKRLKKDAAE